MNKTSEIQTQYSSSLDKRKICSYDIEFIQEPTNPIMHQESRLLFFTKGKGIININNTSFNIKANSCVSIAPWVITEITEIEEPLQFIKIVYNFNFLNQNIKSIYTDSNENIKFFKEIYDCPVIYCNEIEYKNFISILNDIKTEIGIESILDIKEEKILTNLFLINKIIELLIWFIRIEKKVQLKNKFNKNPNFEERSTIFKYLYSHLSEKQTIKSVSSLFFMSESSLSNYCKKITGHSFHDLLDQMRLVKTIDFLIYSDFSLNIIAEFVGFNDASHLSKFFTSNIGTTPNQYRKINKNIVNMLNTEEKSIAFDIIEYITNIFMDKINEVEVANKFDISVAELNKILLYTIEKNFDQLITYLRINYSCELLKSTKNTILDIAISVGYNNSKTFNNHFFKLKGMTPSNFRKMVEIQYDYN